MQIKVTQNDPKLNFVEKPLNPSKSALILLRAEEMMKQLRKLESTVGNFKDKNHRLEEREEALMRLGYKETKGRTKGAVHGEMKSRDNEHLTAIYGNISVGINGELPKFSKTPLAKEGWWKSQKTWNPNPKTISSLHMSQQQKWWAKNDELKMADSTSFAGPVDTFKQTHVPKQKKNQVQPKVSETCHWSKTEASLLSQDPTKREALKVRWSEKESMIRCNAASERLFEKLVR